MNIVEILLSAVIMLIAIRLFVVEQKIKDLETRHKRLAGRGRKRG